MLPRGVAAERLHHDIVRLLDEYVVPNSQDSTNAALSGRFAMSPNVISSPATLASGKFNRSKKRPKTLTGGMSLRDASGNPVSPTGDGPQCGVSTGATKKRASVKRKKDPQPPIVNVCSVESSMSTLSPVGSLESPRPPGGMEGTASPLSATNLYNGHMMAMSHPNLTSLNGGGVSLPLKQPPAYEDCMQGHLPSGHSHLGHRHVQPQHSHSKSHVDQSYLNGTMGMMGGGGLMTQPGQLPSPAASHHALHLRQNSLPAGSSHFSPNKQRPTLPTSPTHMAAMQAATHQKHGHNNPNHMSALHSPPYTLSPQQQQQPTNGQTTIGGNGLSYIDYGSSTKPSDMMQLTQQFIVPPQRKSPPSYMQYHQYPTPPSQHSQGGPESTPQHLLNPPENYLTPSPESPGQWSSSSPHSAHSDCWSDGISSPPTATAQMGYVMAPVQDQHQGLHKLADAVYI